MKNILLILLVLYFVISNAVFRFRHPQMTETELFLHIPEAITFRAVGQPNQNKHDESH